MAKQARAPAPTRRRHAADDPELIDWHEPAQNARVLDWRQRAEAFGLNPIADDGGTDGPVVLPAEQLIDEEEPEATAPLGFNDVESVEPVPDDDEPADARLPVADTDPVRVYLQEIGRRRLLTSAQEQEIGGRIEAARAALLAELPLRAARALLPAVARRHRAQRRGPGRRADPAARRRRADAGPRPAGPGRAGAGRRDGRRDRGRRRRRAGPGAGAASRPADPPVGRSTPSSPSCGPRPRRPAARTATPPSTAWRSARTR